MAENIREDFLKARFNYCKEIFYKMEDNNEKLETKMKFLTSFMVVFLSAIILNINSIEKLKEIISTGPGIYFNIVIRAVYFLITAFFLFSLFCVFMAMKVRSFDEIYPRNFSEKFLFSETEYFLNEDETVTKLKDAGILNSFYYTITKVIINSITTNSKILQEKAKWFQRSWSSLLWSIFLMCICLILVLIK